MSKRAERIAIVIVVSSLIITNSVFLIWLLDQMKMELLVNIFLSIITGLLTGAAVTVYYRKRDEEIQFRNQLNFDKQTMSRYIDIVLFELSELMTNGSRDTKVLRRMLVDPPRFLSFDPSKLKEECGTATRDIYNELDNLLEYLENKEPEEQFEMQKIKYIIIEGNLREKQTKILKIQMK